MSRSLGTLWLQEVIFMRLSTWSVLGLGICALCLFLGMETLSGQQGQPEIYQRQETLKTNTRLVIVDVVAIDSHGQPVSDLSIDDFTVLEEGRQQRISHFSFQHPGEVQAVPVRPLPPNVVSNAPVLKSNTLNVIVLDSVNGDFSSQAYAIDQLAKFFAVAKLEQPVALFALESRIKLLRDFTTDGAALKAALQGYKPPAQAANTESIESRASAFATRGDYHTDDRNIQTTLNQLNALAKTLAGYPGRKNLIWLTESFPLNLFPEQVIPSSIMGPDLKNAEAGFGGGPSQFEMMRDNHSFTDYSALVKKLADSMMAAQVAVYPVDAAGVGRNDHLASQHTANDMAARTGGKAFHNTNDLGAAMQTSLNDGSTYYTLEYYPHNKKWDGQFRLIQVKTSHPGISLRYRLGYYALDPEKESKEQADLVTEEFSRSLQVDSPAATAVRFQAGVVPPSNQTKNKLVVNFAVDPHTVHFDRSDDGMEHARISCTVWAYGANKDKPIMSRGDTSKADLKPDVYEQMMKQYFPCHQELELKPGNYTLRLGVLDHNSNLIGTTSASVTVQ
jgi:VWFA-related protein